MIHVRHYASIIPSRIKRISHRNGSIIRGTRILPHVIGEVHRRRYRHHIHHHRQP